MGEGKDVEIIRWEIKGMVMLESYRLGQLTISLFMLLFSRILKYVKDKQKLQIKRSSIICFVCSKSLVFGKFGSTSGIIKRKAVSRKIVPCR